jgi:hypothetical protein
MTLAEFKAWFKGYTENMKSTPTLAQWERIKDCVEEINNVNVTYPIFVEKYVQPYHYWWEQNLPRWISTSTTAGAYNSLDAMNYAGKAEYASN